MTDYKLVPDVAGLVEGGARCRKQPLKSSLALDAATHLTNWLDMNLCECEDGHTCGYNDVKRTRDALLVVAEQQQPVCPTCYGLGWSEDCQNEFRPATCPDCAGSGKAEHSITVQEAAEQQPDVTQLAEAPERQNKLPVERGES